MKIYIAKFHVAKTNKDQTHNPYGTKGALHMTKRFSTFTSSIKTTQDEKVFICLYLH